MLEAWLLCSLDVCSLEVCSLEVCSLEDSTVCPEELGSFPLKTSDCPPQADKVNAKALKISGAKEDLVRLIIYWARVKNKYKYLVY